MLWASPVFLTSPSLDGEINLTFSVSSPQESFWGEKFSYSCLNWIFINSLLTSLTHRAESLWPFTWHVGTPRVAGPLGFWPIMKPPETQLPPEKQGLTLYLAYRVQCYNEELRSHREQCHDLYIVLAKVFSCAPRNAKKVAISPRGHGKAFSEGASIMRQ